jgi:outer membrane receptor for ferrienterochelin and colicin
MNNKINFSFSRINLVAALALLVMAIPLTGGAQGVTSAIRGTVTGPDGSPAAGATVSIVDTRTGTSKGSTTSASGVFNMSGLQVGGPYTVTIESTAYAEQEITDIYLELGDTYTFTIALGEAALDVITVTAAAIDTVQVALGPSSTFTLEDLQNAPAFNRDIKDVIRTDPRIYIDEADVEGIQCLGASPRFNSITVDGVKLNDNFGINRSGYPTQRMPFPYDAIEQVAVELAPFDVQYGGFTACNINAVTKSGTNEFHGTVFYDYIDESLRGDKLEGQFVGSPDFDEKRYGLSIGGPIIKDKLFFFAAYEKAETADIYPFCAGDEVCGSPVLGVSSAQIQQIADIARNLYNYDPGEPLGSAPNEDEKYLVKLDWNITDSHRASLNYNYNDGFNVAQSDNDDDEYEFSNHFYNRGGELKSYAAFWHANWTDNFSTELRIGHAKLENTHKTRNDVGFAEVQIETYFQGEQALVYLGGDDSRQSNKLIYETDNFRASGTLVLGDHTISGGFEFETVDIFNMFVQHTIGEYRFDETNATDVNGNPHYNCGDGAGQDPSGCIAAFADFSPDDIYHNNAAGTNNPADLAAVFESTVNTLYLQDEFTMADGDVTIIAGLRYDWYTSDDLPTHNPNFEARSGFTNQRNFDGEDLLQPRLGVRWDVNDTLTLHGGFGLYSGGNPNVWLGNNYQNDGIKQVALREGSSGIGLDDLNEDPTRNLTTEPLGADGTGSPMYDPPQVMIDAITSGSANGGVNAIQPGFKIPNNWKYAIGATWEFDAGPLGEGYVLQGDYIYTKSEDSAVIRDDILVQVGTQFDGRPIYFQTDKSVPGCEADPLANPFGCGRQFDNDYILSNVVGDDAESQTFSLALSKSHDFGLDWTIGYAHTDADDVAPMTSSVAFSNYILNMVSDPNDPGLATSNYQIGDRITLKLAFGRQWFGDNYTRFTLYGSANEGRPYSYTFNGMEGQILGPFFNFDNDRSLLYVPTDINDPNVVFDPGFDDAEFFAFVDAVGLARGQTVPRNAFTGSWWTKFDFKVSQEIPGFGDHKGSAFIIIENFGNLLNDDWGVLYEQSFPRNRAVVDATYDMATDQYTFTSYRPGTERRVQAPSLWQARIGVTYRF